MKLGAEEGEIDAFDSPSLDGRDGIACNLIVALEEHRVRRSTAIPFLNALVTTINLTLASGEVVTLPGFGEFATEELEDGRVLATFEPQFEFGLSIIIGLHDQMMIRVGHELTHVVQQGRKVSRQVLATRSPRVSPHDFNGLQNYHNIGSSTAELVILGEEFGDEPLSNLFEKLQELVLSLEEDFTEFYEKDNKAAGTRVRKGMQELKDLAQDIRVEVHSIKNNG
jgi:hypothetical protein